ncbi:uncharacterized protein BP01DRAFT_354498 [Aspergillus saccharolyticus JOP 1030-1]|uniref:Uncharacterized protein n=1 Tax=Aspergillus saccharolyticus JOP 1030-1 TaxID=1450539 RepID=A0A318ZIG1_9EURO|nr:hypothetical protein BP01DRAFT_354498 [Aspergillus saccharolyticus JOP 1030-1]PYH47299.1 hypothetical protein BP01DRAFT_354498 [Aspergillus saccharolyticus JOP 1030-1]
MALFRNPRTAAVQLRGFATSSSLRVGPESPSFIDVPRVLQPNLPSKPRVKGVLPVPREIFPSRRTDKPTEAYISAATPLPTKEKRADPNDPNYEYIEQKKQMAEMRRQNLREGLLELHARKQATDKTMKWRSEQKQQLREQVLRQPERLDVQLTQNTIVKAMLPKRTPVLPCPGKEALLRKSTRRFQRKQAQKKAARGEHLHELYMNARQFIVDETQLAAEIERVFPDDHNPAWRSDQQEGKNIWNLGYPQTVSSLVNEGTKTESARFNAIQARIKKLGEEITGGKF